MLRFWSTLLILSLVLSACSEGLPQVTPTVAPTSTPTPEQTRVAEVPTETPVIRLTDTPTATITLTWTLTPSDTPTLTPTPSDTPTGTPEPTSTPTNTPTQTDTPTPSDTPTGTPSNTPTHTPTRTPSPTDTPTGTPEPTDTPTQTGTPTNTPAPTLTRTPTLTPTPSDTPEPTDTPTQTSTVTPSLTPFISPTPTVTPSSTPTDTPTSTPTQTDTPTPSDTPEPSVTPSSTPTDTPTNTPLPTDTPSPTNTPEPSVTPSNTPTNTPTRTPTQTDTPTPSDTPEPSVTPSDTPTPTRTPTPTFDAPRATALEATRLALIPTATDTSIPPTWTPVPPPTATSTLTLIPPATLDVTPTQITATPGATRDFGLIDTVTPVLSTPEPQPEATDIAPTDVASVITAIPPTPTPFTPTPVPPQWYLPNVVTLPPPPQFDVTFNSAVAQAYTFNVSPGTPVTYNGAPLRTDKGMLLFAPNPVYPESFLRVDETGGMLFVPPGGNREGEYTASPYHDGFAAGSAASNKNFVSDIAWAPNGQWFAFIVSPPPGTDPAAAGLWWWQPDPAQNGPSYVLMRDCPIFATNCDLVANRPASHWQSRRIEWANDSTWILNTVSLPDEGRFGLATVPIARDNVNVARPIARYDSGWWLPDGRIMVSGRRPDGTVIIGVVDRDFSTEQVLFNASAAGFWAQDAVQRGNGEILFLGNPGPAGGPVALYRLDATGPVAISPPIGGSAPSNVAWSANRNQVVVTAGGRQYSVNAVTGSVTTPQTAGALDFAPGNGSNPVQPAPEPIPQGVVDGSRYSPGQQVQFISDTGRNLRDVPNLSTSTVIGGVEPGEFVAILAGPYQSDGFGWWFVGTARNQQGWIAVDTPAGSLLNP